MTARHVGRRGAAGGGLAMLVLAAAAAGSAKAEELDGELLAAFARWQPWEDERKAIAMLPEGDPTWQARFDAYGDGWHDEMRGIISMPARTPDGVRAKAIVLRALLENHHDCGTPLADHEPDTVKLTWSFLSDLLGRKVG